MKSVDSSESRTKREAVGLTGIAQTTWAENILFSVLVELTYRCNLDCFFCYNDVNLQGRPLSQEQYFRFFEDLADLQVLNLTLSGGEPLAHPHFFALGAKARDLGFVVRLKSNGHALHGELARRLREEVDPYVVEVSLHGSTAEVHDRQTRVEGSFDRLMTNLQEMTELGLRLQLNSTLTRWNEHQIEEMLAISDRLGVRMLIDPEVTPRDDGDKSPLEILPSAEAIETLYRTLFERAASGRPAVEVRPEGDSGMAPAVTEKHCGAGSSTVAVDPYGAVYPCVQWRWSVGNLHENSIREIWRQSPKLVEVRDINKDVKTMISGFGEQGSRMGFCPGSAWLNTGEPMEIYRSPMDKLTAHEKARCEDRELLPVLR